MLARWAALALTVILLVAASLPMGMSVARAQAVTQAEQEAANAKSQRDSAYAVVSDAVDNRSAVESELFDALNRYEAATAELAAANRKFDEVSKALAKEQTQVALVHDALQRQAVAAYMQAVGSPGSVVIGARTVEQAMVVGQAIAAGQGANLEQLDTLAVQQAELDRIMRSYGSQRDHVAQLEAQLATESDDLQSLFSRADARVAAAYQSARAADAAYQSALTGVERAREAEEQKRREQAAATTTTTTTTPGDTTPTTRHDPPPIKPGVEQWRSLVSRYFRADLVEDALRIMQCESLGDPNAVNPYSGAAGLYQFLPGTWAVAAVGAGFDGASMFDPEANIASAAWLAGYYEANGSGPWAPWACRYYL